MTIKVTTTFTLDGKSPAEYPKILEYFEIHEHEKHGYTLIKEPLVNRVTALKVEEVQAL